MSERNGCKGCLDPEQIAAAERLWDRVVLGDGDLVPEAQYRQRLSLCESCDALLGGTTCRYCGCLVRWRAKLAASSCPFPQSPKW